MPPRATSSSNSYGPKTRGSAGARLREAAPSRTRHSKQKPSGASEGMDAPQRGHFLTDELFNRSTYFYRIRSRKFCQKSLPILHFFTVRTGVTSEYRLHSSAEQ